MLPPNTPLLALILQTSLLLDAVLHRRARLLLLLSSSRRLLALSTNTGQTLQRRLRLRLSRHHPSHRIPSFPRASSGSTPPSLSAPPAHAYTSSTARRRTSVFPKAALRDALPAADSSSTPHGQNDSTTGARFRLCISASFTGFFTLRGAYPSRGDSQCIPPPRERFS